MYFILFSDLFEAAGLFLSPFVQVLSKVVSSELDPLDRGVVDWLWFGRRWSYCPVILCEGSQEHLYYEVMVGGFGYLCQFWPVEARKLGENRQKFGPPRWFSVVFLVLFL